MNFRKMMNPDCLGADDFVDDEFKPKERTLEVESVVSEKPPAGGKTKACFRFLKCTRKAFLSNGELKKIARFLRIAETDRWVGVKLTITSAPKKFGGQMTTGMVVVAINGIRMDGGENAT